MHNTVDSHIASGVAPFILSTPSSYYSVAPGTYPNAAASGLQTIRTEGVAVMNPQDFSVYLGAKSTGITVTTTAAPLISSALVGRRVITIYNNGAGPIYIGGSDVTTSNGYPIPATGQLSIDLHAALTLWAVAGSSINVRILELA